METAELRRLIEAHQGMVFSMALRITGEHGVAEEVAQDVFLQMFQSGERLQSDEHVKFWLRRVTVHRATDALRRRAVRPESGAEEWTEELHSMEVPSLSVAIMGWRMEELLQTLPETIRVAVVLRYQEELLPQEIAELLGQPVATVKSNLQRGLRLLRRKAAVTMKEYVRGEA